jgi:hypothetical protein
MNVLFDGNDVHTMGNQTGASPWGFIVADVYAPASYYAYTGNIQIANNTIQRVANGNNCLLLVGNGTVVSGNTITATGSATGINVTTSAKLTNNTINIGNGTGIMLQALVDATSGGKQHAVRDRAFRHLRQDSSDASRRWRRDPRPRPDLQQHDHGVRNPGLCTGCST